MTTNTAKKPQMKRAYIRSIIFNLFFYGVTAFMCFAYILLLPLPRHYFISAIHFWLHIVHMLEKYILGLDYEIRGLEHLPKDGAYIVAAKHQSAYETFKLHLLFDDPAIILKQELLKIPLWGLFLKKADPIAIDRSSPEQARMSINAGARHVKEQGRPIIIFPQGTRVRPEHDKPYKSGIFGIQEATDLPVIPLALNTGSFWPRNDFFKSPGKVIFEFLAPIPPGKTKQEFMTMIEEHVEGRSKVLTEEAVGEARKVERSFKTFWLKLAILFAILFGAYSYVWFQAAERIKLEYYKTLAELTGDTEREESMLISGYPGMINLGVAEEVIATTQGTLTLNNIKAVGWVFPGLPVHIEAGPVNIQDRKWTRPLSFDHIDATFEPKSDQIVELVNSEIRQNSFVAKTAGAIDLSQEPIPKLDLNIALVNHQDLIGELAKNRIIDPRMALFLGAGLGGLMDENGVIEVPLTQRGNALYVGPVPVLRIPERRENSLSPEKREGQLQKHLQELKAEQPPQVEGKITTPSPAAEQSPEEPLPTQNPQDAYNPPDARQ